ncbi:hypothetical protein [Faecalibaculum rodentium]|nr:hypothetical protein [Faecalibaculum rodentium]
MNRKGKTFVAAYSTVYVLMYLLDPQSDLLSGLVLASMLSITSARKQEIRMLRDLGASDWTVFCCSLKSLLAAYALCLPVLLELPVTGVIRFLIFGLYLLFTMSVICEYASGNESVKPLIRGCLALIFWLSITDSGYRIMALCAFTLPICLLLHQEILAVREMGFPLAYVITAPLLSAMRIRG